jgi:hypothetical protein
MQHDFIIDSRYAIIPAVTEKIQTPHHCRLRRKAIQLERSANARAAGDAGRMDRAAEFTTTVGRL